MKKLTILLFSLISFCALAQTKTAHGIKIYLEDACEQKNVKNAVVTVEGYNKSPIVAKYNKSKKYYYFKNMPNDYNTIFVSHNDFEIEGYKKIDSFPKRIKLFLQCKGNIRPIEINKKEIMVQGNHGYYHSEIKIDTVLTRDIYVRDNYKVKISIKKSYNMSFNEVKRKIDSIVEPYGLEYIDDLVPQRFFAHFNGLMINNREEISFPFKSLDKNESMSDLLIDNQSVFAVNEHGDFEKDSRYILWDEFYFELLYRKKDKSAFRGDFDLTLGEILEKNNALRVDLLTYYKFRIGDEYPLKINCENLKKYDSKIMNYQFLKDYDNDATRVLFMDKYFEFRETFLGKYELDKSIDGEVEYYPPPHIDKSNFDYKLELSIK